jgi:CheY-like chemotaxis protein
MQTDHFEMVFMDVAMPQLDGLTTIERFRAWEQSDTTKQRPPIAVVTAKAFSNDREDSYCAGCDVYLTKPVGKKLLLENFYRFTASKMTSSEEDGLHDETEEYVLEDKGDILLNHTYL